MDIYFFIVYQITVAVTLYYSTNMYTEYILYVVDVPKGFATVVEQKIVSIIKMVQTLKNKSCV